MVASHYLLLYTEGDMIATRMHIYYRNKKNNVYRLCAVATAALLVCSTYVLPVSAAWNPPTCDPDAVGGPTDATCNVAAPINTANVGQTKAGSLTIQNTITADDLIVQSSGTGNGSVQITTTNSNSLTITQNHAASKAIDILQNSSSADGVYIGIQSSGNGINVIQTGTGSAARFQHTSANTHALEVVSKSTFDSGGVNDYVVNIQDSSPTAYTTPGTALNVSIQASGVTSGAPINPGASQGTAIDIKAYQGQGVYAFSEQHNALVGRSAGGDGVVGFTSNSGSYGVYGNNISTAAGYGGLFVADTVSSSGAALRAENTNVAATITAQFLHGGITAAAIPGLGKAAVDVQTNIGYGGYFDTTDASGVAVIGDGAGGGVAGTTSTGSYGTYGGNTAASGHGGWFTATGTGGYGVYANSTNSVGVVGVGGQGGVTGTTSAAGYNGVYGSNTSGSTGYGGYFETDSGDAALYAGNTNTGTSYGAHIESAGSTSTALYVENTSSTYGTTKYGAQIVATTPQGIGLSVSSPYGTAGQFDASSGGTAIAADASGGGKGIDITVDPYGTAIDANNGFITGAAGILGSPVYPRSNPASTIQRNTSKLDVVASISTGGLGGGEIEFDGSHIWFADPTSQEVTRIDAQTGIDIKQYSFSYDVSMLEYNPSTPGSTRYLAISDQGYGFLYLYDTSAPASHFTGFSNLTAAALDNESGTLWLANSSGSFYEFTFSGIPSAFATGYGAIHDLIVIDGYLYAADFTNNQIVKFDITNTTSVSTISTTSRPRDFYFDGKYLWYVSSGSSYLGRMDIESEEIEEFDVSSITGSGNAKELTSDGANIWIGFSDGAVGYFNIASQTVGSETLSVYTDSVTDLLFDGNYLWVGRDAGTVQKVDINQGGYGQASTKVSTGLLMYNSSGTLYCVYMNGSTLTSTTSLSNCR